MGREGRCDQRLAAVEAPSVPPEGKKRLKAGARLSRRFFGRPSTEVAPDLLGRILVRRLGDGQRLTARIVEAEAYGPEDPASHGYRGRTERNAAMFGPPGHLYVYFTYGMHFCMNVVTGRPDEGSAVLLRAAEPLEGIDEMRRRRGRGDVHGLCSGPAKLCQALAVDRTLDGADLVLGSDLWILEGMPADRSSVRSDKRIGISAGKDRRWRFSIVDDPFVSPGRRRRLTAG